MKIFWPILFLLAMSLQSATFLGALQDPVFESASICSNCHDRIYKAWNEGPHAKSWNNLVYHAARAGFMRASAGEGILYCENCHAPLAVALGDRHFMNPLVAEGVNCDACHTASALGEDSQMGPRPTGGEVKIGLTGECPPDLHGCRKEPALASPEFCAVCHQLVNLSGVPVYTEYSEWKNSRYREQGTSCIDCHASTSDGKRDPEGSHALVPLEGANGMLRRAITVQMSIRRAGETVLYVTVKNNGAGHSVPGGPPIRSIRLDVRGYDENNREVYSDTTTVLSRVVEGPISTKTGLMLPWLGWKEAKDDRLSPGQSRGYAFGTGRDDVVRGVVKVLYIRFDMAVEEDFFGDEDRPVMASAAARLNAMDPKPTGSQDVGPSPGTD